MTLIIDTSTKQLYVAIVDESEHIFDRVHIGNNDHSTHLIPLIEEILDDANIAIKDLTKIVVSSGPGSYTGIRIGMTVAKMFAWDKDIPLFHGSSFAFMISDLIKEGVEQTIGIIIDARRNSGFCALYRVNGLHFEEIQPAKLENIDAFIDECNQFEGVKYVYDNDFEVNPISLLKSNGVSEVDNIHLFTPNYLRNWGE